MLPKYPQWIPTCSGTILSQEEGKMRGRGWEHSVGANLTLLQQPFFPYFSPRANHHLGRIEIKARTGFLEGWLFVCFMSLVVVILIWLFGAASPLAKGHSLHNVGDNKNPITCAGLEKEKEEKKINTYTFSNRGKDMFPSQSLLECPWQCQKPLHLLHLTSCRNLWLRPPVCKSTYSPILGSRGEPSS